MEGEEGGAQLLLELFNSPLSGEYASAPTGQRCIEILNPTAARPCQVLRNTAVGVFIPHTRTHALLKHGNIDFSISRFRVRSN